MTEKHLIPNRAGHQREPALAAVRVPGHTLRSEGKPYKVLVVTEAGTQVSQRVYDSKTGRALCSCGALSDLLTTDGQRKRWHRAHKTEIRERNPR